MNAMIVAIGHARKEETYRHLTRLEEIWNAEGVYFSETAESMKQERVRE